MPIPGIVRSFLKDHHIKYEALYHPSSYTAQQLAHVEHITGGAVIKVVLIKSGGESVMVLLPASYKLDFTNLKKVLKNNEIRLCTEEEIRKLFPDCEIGAEPPFGNLYGLKVYADESLLGQKEVLCFAGTHREAMQIKYEDLIKWTKPQTCKVAVHL